MGARKSGVSGSFETDRLERSHILQAIAGTSANEKKITNYQNVHLLIVRFSL
jgi:hypothetical protein